MRSMIACFKKRSVMRKIPILLLLLLFTLNEAIGQSKAESSFDLELGSDATFFFKKGAFNGQKQFYPSFYIQPEYSLSWNEGLHNINFKGFFRYDPNGNSRTHFDIREMYYQYVKDRWELSIGAKKIFWGKTESAHLVDVINQTDFLEGLDGEEKLGQPMVQFSYLTNFGTFDLFYLPYSRQLNLGNAAGRPRTPVVLNDDDFRFESNAEEWHPSGALRWSHYIGPMDIGLHYFYGNAREPLLDIREDGSFGLLFPKAHQVGLDYQIITGNWLWKVESILRMGSFDNIFASAAGFEYTFSNVGNTGLDIGVLAEYLYDNRGDFAFSSLDNDLFLATRFAFNDVQSTEFLAGFAQDLSQSSKFFRLEASRRIGENYKFSLESQVFISIDDREFLSSFKRDSYLRAELIRFF